MPVTVAVPCYVPVTVAGVLQRVCNGCSVLLHACYGWSVPAACLSRLQCSCCMPVTVTVFLLHDCQGCSVPVVCLQGCSVLLHACYGCSVPAACLSRLQCSCCMPVTVTVFLLHDYQGCSVPVVCLQGCSVLLHACHGCSVPAVYLSLLQCSCCVSVTVAVSCACLSRLQCSCCMPVTVAVLIFMLTSNMSNGHFPTFFYWLLKCSYLGIMFGLTFFPF